MARRGPDQFFVKCTTVSSTGAFRDITQQVYSFSGFSPEAILEQSNTFGDTFEEHSHVGVNRIPAITLSGPWDDDTSTGTAGIFGVTTDLGAERVLRINYVGGTTGTTGAAGNLKVDVIVQSYKRMPARGALTQYEVVLQPTGAFTATTTT